MTRSFRAHPKLRHGVPLGPLTTYRRGGDATWFLPLDDDDDWAGLTVEPDVPVLVLGRGSNLLVADAGFPGLVIAPGRGMARVAVDPDGTLTAGSAASLPVVARAAAAADRGGLAWMVGVPGSVGGAVATNAGCHGSDTATWLRVARILDLTTGAVREVAGDGLGFDYRRSDITARDLVVSGTFATIASSRTTEEATMREITRWRRLNQPGGTHNAGSVFKNPPGDAAGRLIDAAGLKGFSVGGARVSPRHANFIEAAADATAADIRNLIEAVRRRVLADTGIDLEPEVRMVGFAP